MQILAKSAQLQNAEVNCRRLNDISSKWEWPYLTIKCKITANFTSLLGIPQQNLNKYL